MVPPFSTTLFICPRKWLDPVTRSSFQRVKLIGDIIGQYEKVIYLVPFESDCPPIKINGVIEYCSPFRYGDKIVYILSDFNFLLLWQIHRCVKKNHPSSIWFSGPFGIISTKILFPRIKVAYLSHDIASDTPEITASTIQKSVSLLRFFPSAYIKILLKVYLTLIERLVCYISKVVLTQGETDKARYLSIYNNLDGKVISLPTPIDESIKPHLNRLVKKSKKSVIFHGTYSYLPNKEAIDFIIYRLAAYFEKVDPSIEFIIAGTHMPKTRRSNVKILGFVEDLNEFLMDADLAIIPVTKGTGLRTKALDYMLSGVPLITTRIGVGGISVINDVHAVIIDNLEKMPAAIIALLFDEAKMRRLANNAFQLVMREYSVMATEKKLNDVAKILFSVRTAQRN